jgi:hypothetical protein
VPQPKPKPVCDVPQPDAAPSADDLAGDPGIADLTGKIEANANDAVSRYKRGKVYANKRAYALAMQDFDAVVRLAPKDAEALNNRCWTGPESATCKAHSRIAIWLSRSIRD